MKNLIIVILLFPAFIYPQSGSIKGKVTENGQPIPSVNIFFMEAGYGTVSDEDGYYLLKGIPAGEYNVRFSSVGYQTLFFDVVINSGKSTELDAELSSAVIEVGQVEVTGIKQQKQKDTRTSLIDLNPRSAKILPGAAEDVLRTLQALPGVLAPSDFSSQLVVRGSGPDQNLIIMDDIEIFNPYRLYGVISMFNPDAVSDVNLITGGFPAKYGDRLSAVLDVTNREGSRKKAFTGSLNASIVDANLVIEGKNPFNLTGSWILNTRRTYYDLIVEPFVKNAGLVEDNVTFPNFYDIQGKIAIGPYNGHKFILNGIYSRDGVNIVSAEDRKTADSISVYNVTKNDVAGFSWHYAPNPKLLNKFIISWYRNSGAVNFNSQIIDPSVNRRQLNEVSLDTIAPYLLNFKFDADFSFIKYSLDNKFTYLWGENEFEAGIGADILETLMDFRFKLDPELEAFIASNAQFRSTVNDIKDNKIYNRYRGYLQNNFKLSDKLYFQPGLRGDYYNILNSFYLAPRISMSYALDDITTLRAVWGTYYQSPGYEKLRDQNVLYNLEGEYLDILEPEKAVHYVLGLERWLTEEWNARIETYYKDFAGLIIPKRVDGARYFTEPVPGADPRYASGWTRPIGLRSDSLTQIPVNKSYGEAYGIELFLSKKNIMSSTRLSGWVSYSLAFADRYEYGEKLPFRFDQRNTVNIVLNYEVNSWLDVGARWQYGSGFPYTEAVGIKPRIIMRDSNGDGIPDSPEIATRRSFTNNGNDEEVIYDVDFGSNQFNARRPAYHRLDIRGTAEAYFWNLDWTFYLDIINVYNRGNVVGYDYFITEDLKLGREATTMFPILPTIGFSVKF